MPAALPEYGVFVIESRHSDRFEMDWTTESFLKVLHVFDGEGTLATSWSTVPLSARSWAMIPAGVKHRIVDAKRTPLSLYVLCLAVTEFDQWLDPAFAAKPQVSMSASAGGLDSLFKELLFEQTTRRPGYRANIMGTSLKLLGSLERAKVSETVDVDVQKSSEERVASYYEEMKRSFYLPITLESAAAGAGLSVRRFTQLFRHLAGQSWLQCLRELRLQHSQVLLRDTTRSILSVCFECGFDDVSNFYRAFHAKKGISPQRWRERELSRCAVLDTSPTRRPAGGRQISSQRKPRHAL